VIALCALAVLVASQALARGFNLALYLLATSAAALDLIDMAIRLYLCRRHGSALDTPSIPLPESALPPRQKRLHLRPYAIVASIHNAEDHLDEFLRVMAPYRDRVWLVDDASTDLTPRLLRQAGWRCVESRANLKKPGALRTLLEAMPREVETLLVIDPDIVIRENSPGDGPTRLESIVFDFQRSGRAAACPRVAIVEDGLLTRFQALEYCMSFSLGRRSLGPASVTSGIALYRREDLAFALSRHSLSVYAEDFENAVLLLDAGRSIYYDGRLVVDTEGKRRWRDWFSQRVGWHYGLLRVYAGCLASVRRIARSSLPSGYHYMVYTGIFCIAMQPVKVAGLVVIALGLVQGVDALLGLGLVQESALADPAYAFAAWAKYTTFAALAATLAVPRGERRTVLPVVPLYFFYAAFHIVPASVGYLNWLSVRLRGRRLFADHYQDESSLVKELRHG
jgi:hypothetical protein